MYIADRADRSARILAALTPDGVSLRQLVPIAEMCRENCGALMRQMAAAGMVWSARGRKDSDEDHQAYYFATEQDRDTWLAAYNEVKKNRKRVQLRQGRLRQVDPAIAARVEANKAARKRLAEKRAQERAATRDAKAAAKLARRSMSDEERAEARRARDRERKRVKAAKSMVARMPGRKQIDTAQMLYRIRDQEATEASHRRSNQSTYELTEEDLKKVRVSETPKPRFWVDPETKGAFGSLPPGQYAFEANSCAARAAA